MDYKIISRTILSLMTINILFVIHIIVNLNVKQVIANSNNNNYNKIDVNKVNIDPKIASSIEFSWPENGSFVPSNTKLGIQTTVGFIKGLPPVRIWLRFCLSLYENAAADDDNGDINNKYKENNCNAFRESNTIGFNVIVPKNTGRHILISHMKFCLKSNPSLCLFTVSDPVIFNVYKSSGFIAFDDIFAALPKVESPNAKKLLPLSSQSLKTNGLHNDFELIILSPDKTITAFHQLLVKYAFVYKKNKTIAPLMPGEICITLVSDYSHFTSMDACAAVSASATYDISEDIPSDNGEDNIGKHTNVNASTTGRLLFMWGDEAINASNTSSKDQGEEEEEQQQRRGKYKVHPGLVYLMATFYYNQSKSNVYRHGEPIDVIHNRKADVISPYNTFFFSNSFIYKSEFSLNLLKDHVLNQRSKEQQLVLFRDDTSSSLTIPNKNSKKYVYMTVVWGNSFVHGVLALATSLKLVGSKFGLVVLIPRSCLSNNGNKRGSMSPSTLAMLEGSLDIQDVLIIDDTGKSDCIFGEKMKNKALKDMICNPKLEEFAYMLTNRLNVKGTPQSIDRRVFLKLVAFGLIAYESVGFIDADAIALNNPDASLLQTNNHFIGVGEGIFPGAFFVLKPSMDEMINMMNILSVTGGRYRFAEMSFLNIYFGSSYNNNNNNNNNTFKVHERFPEKYLCVVMDHPDFKRLQKTCKFVDFASCHIKPWEAIGKKRPVRFSGNICPETPVKGSAWDEAVNYWLNIHDKSIQRTSLHHWENISTATTATTTDNNNNNNNNIENENDNNRNYNNSNTVKDMLTIINPVGNAQINFKQDRINISLALDIKKLISTKSTNICEILKVSTNTEEYIFKVSVCLGRPCVSKCYPPKPKKDILSNTSHIHTLRSTDVYKI